MRKRTIIGFPEWKHPSLCCSVWAGRGGGWFSPILRFSLEVGLDSETGIHKHVCHLWVWADFCPGGGVTREFALYPSLTCSESEETRCHVNCYISWFWGPGHPCEFSKEQCSAPVGWESTCQVWFSACVCCWGRDTMKSLLVFKQSCFWSICLQH